MIETVGGNINDAFINVKNAIQMSKTISRRTFIDFSYLILSMMGWIILSMFHILNFFILPYIVLVYCVHCKFSIYEYNNYLKTTRENNFNLLESDINEF